jgi:carbon storage regulator CsrA
MLVLSRKTNERLILVNGNETIEIVVTKNTCGRVSLGIVAPSHVKVMRPEIMKGKSDGIVESSVPAAGLRTSPRAATPLRAYVPQP